MKNILISSQRSTIAGVNNYQSIRSGIISSQRLKKSLPWSMALASRPLHLFLSPSSSRRHFSMKSAHEIPRNPTFAKLTEEDLAYFRSILDESGVITDHDDIQPYNVDWMNKWSGECPLVLKPTTTEQISKILSYCNNRKIAVVPQGGNTGLVGGSIPIHDEIILNMSRMNKILDLDKVQGIVTVEAGCILETLNRYLEDEGFMVPLDLGAKGSCQIGGNAATAAGGLRFVRYGSLRGTILGLEAVTADGTIVDVLTTLRKDNTGIDIKQLFIGSEGSLGVITKLAILCPPKPNAMCVAYLSVQSYNDVLKAMKLARKHCMEAISATEFQDRDSLNLVLKHLDKTKDPLSTPSPFYILVEVSGGSESHTKEKLDSFLEAAYEEIEGVDGVVSESGEQSQALWKLREGVAEGAGKEGYVLKYDISLPVAQMYDFVEKVRDRIKDVDTATAVGYGHLGDGNLHINIMLSRGGTPAEFDARVAKAYEVIEPWIFEELRKVRGSISAEHGLGQAKNEFIEYSKPIEAVNIMHNIKNMLDPNGIMNPYKYLPARK